MRLLQLNIEAGKRLTQIIEHLQSNDYDFVCLQELASGKRFQQGDRDPNQVQSERYPSLDCFLELQKALPDYRGVLGKAFADSQGENYFGSAIFAKSTFQLAKITELRMGEQRPVEIGDTHKDCDWPSLPYLALAAEFQPVIKAASPAKSSNFQIVTGHFTWSPRSYDTDLTVSRAKIVRDYLAKSKLPFVLTGDFNVNYQTVTCRQFENISRNLVAQLGIRNTLHPEFHRVKDLFPEGIPCDQVFVSAEVNPFGLQVLTEPLSDHLGINLEFEIAQGPQQPIGGLFEYEK